MKTLIDLICARVGSVESIRGEMIRGGVGSIGINISHNLLTLAVTVVLARTLAPAGYGVYAYVYALISLLSVPAQFGLPPLIVRETARGEANTEWGLVRGVFKWSNSIAVVISVAMILIAGSAALVLSDHFTRDHIVTLAWGLVLMPLMALGNLRGAALRGLRKVVQGQLPEKIIRPGLFAVMVAAASLLLSNGALSPMLAMALHVIASLCAVLLGAWMLYRGRPAQISAAQPAYESRKWILTVLPLALTAGMHLVNKYSDVLMLGYFRDAEAVGIYRVSLQGAMLVTFGISAIDMVLAPFIARLHASGDTERLQRLMTTTARFGVAVALLLFLVYAVFGDHVLSLLFGADYLPGWQVLVILSFGRLLNAAAGPVVFLLNMTGHERSMARGVAIATASNIILSLVLIPRYGMEGAAIATAATLIFWNLLLWRSAKILLGIDSSALGLSARHGS